MERNFAETCDQNCPNYSILCEVADQFEVLENVATYGVGGLVVRKEGQVACTGAGVVTERFPISTYAEPIPTCGACEVGKPIISKVFAKTESFKVLIDADVAGSIPELKGTIRRNKPSGIRRIRTMPRR